MSVFGSRLKLLRERRELSQEDLGRALTLHQSTISLYEKGEREPNQGTLQQIAEYFRVSTDYLLGHAATVNETANRYNVLPLGPIVKIPVLGTIRAGEPLLTDENIISWEWIEQSAIRGGTFFYLRVQGDSMIGSRIHDGDLVFVRQQEEVETGEIAVVMVNNEEATLKRVYYQNGTVVLQPDNPKYPPIILSKGDVKILGKVQHVKFFLA